MMDTAYPRVAADVSFDGRYFRYGPYRYDRLTDAVAYAELERAQGRPLPQAPRPMGPVVDLRGWDAAAARALGVTFDGKRFLFDSYRYDRSQDALAYARLQRARQRQSALIDF